MTDELYPYLRSLEPIPERVETALSRGIIDGAPFPMSAAAGLIDGSVALEDGVVRNPDGSVTVCCRTEMHDLDPELWLWWRGWHAGRSDRYRLWHPKAHVYNEIVLPTGPGDSVTNLIDEFFGSRLFKIDLKPGTAEQLGLDPGRAKAANVVAAPVGHSTFRENGKPFCTLTHLIQRTGSGLEMRSRFFLAPDIDESLVQRDYEVHSPASPPRNAGERLGLLLLRHCAEEMNHLTALLPELHKAFGSGQ